jgi:hypothetical protein
MRQIKKSFQYLVDVLQGKQVLPDLNKYRFICYSLAFIHVCIAIRFYSVHYTFLYIYNLASVVFYIYVGTVLPKQKKFYTIYLCTFF